MQRRLLYIVNPISGTRNKQSLQQLIRSTTEAVGLPYDIYPSDPAGDYSALDPIIREKGYTDIVVAGGDGTVNACLAGLKKHRLPFGIIPCGSGNGLAFSAGIPRDPARALEIVFRGKIAWADAFRINHHFACMLCGLGFDAQVAHDFARDPNRGLATYVKQVIRNFVKAATYPFELRVGGKTLSLDAYFISIANSNQFGNNFTIAPRASLTDGLLDVVVATSLNRFHLLLQTFRQVRGFNRLQQVEMIHEQTGILYFQTQDIVIRNPAFAPLHLDGEPVDTAGVIDVAILPGTFQLIFPA
ncbi:diacylglycerol kinase family protein [Paraflavisolibacter sp. H34]|uniref:diacylglycerol/lipid kinase family protein n=1 Tax=Huijunlia imazamoxiresistens TaxID=3127457 RepID=UPI00301A1DBB